MDLQVPGPGRTAGPAARDHRTQSWRRDTRGARLSLVPRRWRLDGQYRPDLEKLRYRQLLLRRAGDLPGRSSAGPVPEVGLHATDQGQLEVHRLRRGRAVG